MTSIITALQKKIYLDWGMKSGLNNHLRMKIIRYIHRNHPHVKIAGKVYLESFGTISSIDEKARLEIGEGTICWGKSSLTAIGSGTLSIGKRCLIGSNNRITARDNISIGDSCLLSWDIVIADYEGHPMMPTERLGQIDYMMEQFNPFIKKGEMNLTQEQIEYFDTYWQNEKNYPHKPITICNNVWIGHSTSILRGSTIGDNTIVGARSLVGRTLPSNCIAVGSPAKIIAKDCNQDDREDYWRECQKGDEN